MPRMTAGDATETEPGPAPRSVALDRFGGVLGTGRPVAARRGQRGRYPSVIAAQHRRKGGRQRSRHRAALARAATLSRSRASSAEVELAAAGLATTTQSFPLGRFSWWVRNHSRTRRFTRLRTTDPPTRRLTVRPRRAGASASPSNRSATRRTNDRDAIRVPSRETRRKSLEDRRRSARRKRSLPPATVTSTASRPPGACGPSRAAARAPSAHPGSSCGIGIHGSVGGGSGWAGTCAS